MAHYDHFSIASWGGRSTHSHALWRNLEPSERDHTQPSLPFPSTIFPVICDAAQPTGSSIRKEPKTTEIRYEEGGWQTKHHLLAIPSNQRQPSSTCPLLSLQFPPSPPPLQVNNLVQNRSFFKQIRPALIVRRSARFIPTDPPWNLSTVKPIRQLPKPPLPSLPRKNHLVAGPSPQFPQEHLQLLAWRCESATHHSKHLS